jgi:serine-type D-Ala-D-Ala carboxypeptidase (penicillin-binding protein 5/6)
VRIPATLLLVTLTIAWLTGLFSPRVAAQEPDVPIEGKSAIVVDVDTGAILFEKQSHDRLAPASLTKIFTAYLALESSPLQRRMGVVKDDLVGEASAGLNAGDNFSMETLLHGMLLASGNDAAMTIARNLGESKDPSGLNGVTSFTSYANSRLEELGLTGTRFINPHGLDAPGHESTAHDIAAITLLALQTEPDLMRILASPGYQGEGTSFAQQFQMFGIYPGTVGGKTGLTDDAGYCQMSIAYRDGRRILSVVLGSTAGSLHADSVALLDRGFSTPVSGDQHGLLHSAGSAAPLTSMASGSIQALAIQTLASDGISIRPVDGARASSWHILRWPIGAVLGGMVALVTIIQLRALIELQKLPKATGRRPRPDRSMRHRTASPPARRPVQLDRRQLTEPFAAVHVWDAPGRSWSAGIGD